VISLSFYSFWQLGLAGPVNLGLTKVIGTKEMIIAKDMTELDRACINGVKKAIYYTKGKLNKQVGAISHCQRIGLWI
jgi:hypothetical protein